MADVEAEERGRGIESNRVGHRARNGSTIGLDQAFKWTIGGGNWVLKRSVFRFCSNFHKNHGEKRRRVIFINIPFRSFFSIHSLSSDTNRVIHRKMSSMDTQVSSAR